MVAVTDARDGHPTSVNKSVVPVAGASLICGRDVTCARQGSL
jgi:hypothetical protein